MVLFVLITWLSGVPSSQQMTTTVTVTEQQCQQLVVSAKENMDVDGRYVYAYCLTTK